MESEWKRFKGPEKLPDLPPPVSEEEYRNKLASFLGEEEADRMMIFVNIQIKERVKEQKEQEEEQKRIQNQEEQKRIQNRDHKCCQGRGCGDCSACYGDCDTCNNLDCHGEECGVCYVCYRTDPRNFEGLF